MTCSRFELIIPSSSVSGVSNLIISYMDNEMEYFFVVVILSYSETDPSVVVSPSRCAKEKKEA